MSETTEREYLEDNIATVAFHLGRPGARLSVQSGDDCGLVVDPGEALKEVSRRLNSHEALVKALRNAKARIAYLGAACTDPRHFESNASTFLPAIDEVLDAVGGSKQP